MGEAKRRMVDQIKFLRFSHLYKFLNPKISHSEIWSAAKRRKLC